jgi:fatty acid amide hydrolase
MGNTGDLVGSSARALAARLRSGEVSAVEAVEAHVARIEEVNGALNAVVVKRYDEAYREAAAADARRREGGSLGPLHGVPVTVKECLDLAGTASTFGFPSRKDQRALRDDEYVAMLRAAGAIVVGKTNVGQALFMLETDNPLYGRTNNPWDITRSPGGSSGGEAAIIACGGSALGLGTDLAGSIRMPAASCGLVGFRPTAGRTPDAGRLSLPIGCRAIVSQVGVLARDVADATLGLEIITAPNARTGGVPVPWVDPAGVELSRLRVAWHVDDGTLAPSAAAARAVREAADILKGLGASVHEWSPPQVPRALDLVFGVFSADSGARLSRAIAGDPKDRRIAKILQAGGAPAPIRWLLRRILHATGRRRLAGLIGNYGHRSTDHYWQLVEDQLEYQQRFRAALDESPGGPFDLILSPACALPAIRHGASEELAVIGGYTALYNLLGYPAGVVPIGRVRAGEETATPRSDEMMDRVAAETERASAGLPLGVQIVARPWQDHLALAAMAGIESVARTRSEYPSFLLHERQDRSPLIMQERTSGRSASRRAC